MSPISRQQRPMSKSRRAGRLVAEVSLGFFWVGHHIMYHAIRRADRILLWLNIFFFMFVSLLPFSTSLLNAFPQAFIAPLFFGANLAVIGWIPFFQWTYVNSQPDMLADFVSAEYRKTVSAQDAHRSRGDDSDRMFCFWSVGSDWRSTSCSCLYTCSLES